MAEESSTFVAKVDDPVAKTLSIGVITALIIISMVALGLVGVCGWGALRKFVYPLIRNHELETGLRELETVNRAAAARRNAEAPLPPLPPSHASSSTRPFPPFNPRFPGTQQGSSSRVDELRRQLSIPSRPLTGVSGKSSEPSFAAHYPAYAKYAEGAQTPPQKPSQARVLPETRHSVDF